MLAIPLALALAPTLPQSFEPEQILTSVNAFRREVVAVDLDEDGDVDLLTFSTGGGQVAWLENTGDGRFQVLRGIDESLPEGRVPVSGAAGDLDGDGRVDVVTAAGDFGPGDSLAWFRGLGGGEFGPPTGLPAQGRLGSLQVADLDGDGDQDLAYIERDVGAFWLENTGAASFAAAVMLGPAGFGSDGLRVTDLDGDGSNDVVWCDRGARSVWWAENLGGGAFAAAVAIGGEILQPRSIAAEDFDQDGDRDLIVGAGNQIFRIENVGGGQFLQRVLLEAVPGNGLTLLVADDADGDLDIDFFSVGLVSTEVDYHENQGGGVFAPAEAIGEVDRDTVAFLVADLDGDGDDDAVQATEEIAWFRNRGGGTFDPPVAATRTSPAVPFDFDGDGDLDLLGTRLDSVVASGNLGDGTFGRPVTLVDGIPGAAGVVALDVGQDGDVDLVVASNPTLLSVTVHLVERTPAGFLPPLELFQAPSLSGVQVRVEERDQGGVPDVVVQYRTRTNPPEERILWLDNAPGVGLVLTTPQFSTGYGINAWADVDGDGDSDYLTLAAVPNSHLRLYRNRDDGFLAPPVVLGGFGPADARPFVTGDVDGDGDQDVVFHRVSNLSLNWFENLGAGTFAPQVFLRSMPTGADDMVATDVDLDGDDDILYWGDGTAHLIESLGGASFGPTLELPNAPWCSSFRTAVAADLDGDGDPDVVREAPNADSTCVQFNEHAFGTNYCDPAVPNSTGQAASIGATGSASIETNDMALTAVSLPPGSAGHFLVADGTGLVSMPGGSQGTLCLGGAIGRLNRGPDEIFLAGASGSVQVALDLTDLPGPMGSSSALPGETRFFQAWYRDLNPTPTSNFTNGLRVRFRLR
ncbi:MAG: VCBS repeat-containing protein [Planctomycetota bacterium]